MSADNTYESITEGKLAKNQHEGAYNSHTENYAKQASCNISKLMYNIFQNRSICFVSLKKLSSFFTLYGNFWTCSVCNTPDHKKKLGHVVATA